MHYFVYILLSLKDNNFYVGYTNDIDRRLAEHNGGKVKSTKNRRPLKLLFYEVYFSKNIAERRELYLKSSDGRKGIRKRLDGFL